MKLFSSETSSLSTKLLAVALVLTISACASKKNSENDPEGSDGAARTDTSSTVSTSGSDDGSASASSNGAGSNLGGADSSFGDMSEMEMDKLLKQTEFKFGFDSFSVNSSDERAIVAHGKFLAKAPLARVRVEGHTDERGTREYNLALGERRAKSVKQVLLSAGAKSKQIEVITYGEEKPKASGANENAYAQNRRVDLEYTVGRP